MKRPLLLAATSFLLGIAGAVPVSQARVLGPALYSCSTREMTPCGEYMVPKGNCIGEGCYLERQATFCPGIVDTRGTVDSTLSAPATMRYLTTLGDQRSGQASGKIKAAHAAKLPNQYIVRNVMFTCPAAPGPADPDPKVAVPPVEKPPEPEVKLPPPVEQVYKDIQVVARHPVHPPVISQPFDIVVRDASVLSFFGTVPPFGRIPESEETSGSVAVYGGEGAIAIGLTGAPSWMVLADETLKVDGRTFTKTAIATPPPGSAGFYRDIRLTARDAVGRTLASPPFTVEVVAPDGLRIVGAVGGVTAGQGGQYILFATAKSARKWISFDVVGGPPGANPVEPVVAVDDGGSASLRYEATATQTGVWNDVVIRATDDQGRIAYSDKFKITVEPTSTCTPGVPATVYAEPAPALGFRAPYRWQWYIGQDVKIDVKGDLPPGIGLCTEGYGLCGTPIANGSWSGEVAISNRCGGTKTIAYALENHVGDQLRPCTGRFSPNNEFAITETDDSYVIGNTKGRPVSFCTAPYNQWDGGQWSDGGLNYSSMYKSSPSYDFIFPTSSLSLDFGWFGSGPMSFVYGSPPQEALDCISRRPGFCTDNVVFRASDALPSQTPGARSGAIYLSGRDWRGRFWGSKKIFVEY